MSGSPYNRIEVITEPQRVLIFLWREDTLVDGVRSGLVDAAREIMRSIKDV